MKKLSDLTDEEVATYMQYLAEATRAVVPDDARFAVFVFEETGRANFVSDGNREDVKDAVRSFFRKWDGEIAEQN